MTKTDTEDWNVVDCFHNINDDTRILRSAGPRRKNYMIGLQIPDLLCRHFIVADNPDIRLNLTDDLIEVIGKAIIVINQ